MTKKKGPKYGNRPTGIYKSRLERTAEALLREHNIEFEYEPWAVVLKPPLKWTGIAYERVGKKFKIASKSLRDIHYTPDFVGDGWIMETKGKRTADFNIRWKLFKWHLMENNLDFILLMPTSKKEILESINIIKSIKL